MLVMLNVQTHVPARRAIGYEFVGDHDPRRSRRLLQKFAQEALRGRSIPPALDQDVENEAVLIDGAPKPMFPSPDRDHGFVEMPLVATNGCTAPNAIGEFPAKFLGP